MSLPLDRRLTEPCLTQENCLTDPGNAGDFRCSDPAFALANPDICGPIGTQPRLVIKPEFVSKCNLEQVTYKTYLISNGAENEVTSGLAYTSSNTAVALIGAIGGKATAIGEGIATISVTWQDLSAHSQFVGLGGDCCDTQKVGMVLVMDNSLSMGQAFSGMYPSKLAFAKQRAFEFASDLNTTKDVMAVVSFNEAAFLAQPFTSTVASVQSAINSIPPTALRTNIDEALETAITALESDLTINRRVIVLITDGLYNEGVSPLARATAFTEAGGVLVVLAVRSHGSAFTLLNAMASGGMFINALPSNQGDADDWFRGTKGYYCAGNCEPPGGVVVNRAQLNYDDFANWTVEGVVDLIGGAHPYELYDLLPGHGLYVDLNGSSAPWLGKLTSVGAYGLTPGQEYELIIHLAGNQRQDAAGYNTRVRLGTVIDETISDVDWRQEFTVYTYTETIVGPEFASIIIEQLAPAGPYGNLLSYVRLRNVTLDTILLEEDFDDENEEFIDPACGEVEIPYGFEGYGYYAYGYNCYGFGCLATPIPAQIPDPSPLPDIEAS